MNTLEINAQNWQTINCICNLKFWDIIHASAFYTDTAKLFNNSHNFMIPVNIDEQIIIEKGR